MNIIEEWVDRKLRRISWLLTNSKHKNNNNQQKMKESDFDKRIKCDISNGNKDIYHTESACYQINDSMQSIGKEPGE